MTSAVNHSRKQLDAMMERYAYELLAPSSFVELADKFQFEISRYDKTMSCHLRTSQGIVIKVDELIEWFEKLPEAKQKEILGE